MAKTKKLDTPKKLSQATLDELFRFKPQHTTQKEPTPPQPRQKRAYAPSFSEENGESDDELGAIRFEQDNNPVHISDSEDESDVVVTSPIRPLAKRRKVAVDSDEEESVPPSSSQAHQSTDSEEEAIPLRRSRRSKQSVIADSDSDQSAPRKRKLVKGKPPSPNTSDVENLANEVDEDRILDSRLRERGKSTAFQKNLERLKRRKQGQKYVSSSEEEDATPGEEVIPFEGARPDDGHSSDESSEECNDQEDGFIVEDDGAALAELPPEFSMSTHEDLAHQFKKIFQFFVHIAIRPPEERHEFMASQMETQQYFSVPLQIVRRKLLGLRDSLVASSVWRADFKTALSTYPDFQLDGLQFALPQCDACHLGGRLSTLIGRLSGYPYDPIGFKDKVHGSDSDSEDSVPEYHLGRFCARRTMVFHKFTHWEHALFSTICREIDELHQRSRTGNGKSNFVRIAFAGAMQPPDDLTDADAICEYLDSRKIIDMEWYQIKTMMDSARNLEMVRAKGGDMDDV